MTSAAPIIHRAGHYVKGPPEPRRAGHVADSTFGERFAFARWWQTGMVLAETDDAFGAAIGLAQGTVSGLKKVASYNEATRGRAIAQRTGVPFDWLMWEDGDAPELFERFLTVHREWQHSVAKRKTAAKATSSKHYPTSLEIIDRVMAEHQGTVPVADPLPVDSKKLAAAEKRARRKPSSA